MPCDRSIPVNRVLPSVYKIYNSRSSVSIGTGQRVLTSTERKITRIKIMLNSSQQLHKMISVFYNTLKSSLLVSRVKVSSYAELV
jgi:hypothetical protein